ncbi:TPA: dTDP-4-dehydrorhamnose 3,5-epimerase family protein, partial [Acinetobacter baumannii]|nr:dTDP-4-dehydrorhamnose 3,5-epimerase family protein [Acinetobacter baumannii]
ESEGAIIWNDPTLAINWPLDEVGEVLVSDKDQIADAFKA